MLTGATISTVGLCVDSCICCGKYHVFASETIKDYQRRSKTIQDYKDYMAQRRFNNQPPRRNTYAHERARTMHLNTWETAYVATREQCKTVILSAVIFGATCLIAL